MVKGLILAAASTREAVVIAKEAKPVASISSSLSPVASSSRSEGDRAADVVGLVEDLVAGDLDREALALAAEPLLALGPLLPAKFVCGQVREQRCGRQVVCSRHELGDVRVRGLHAAAVRSGQAA
jgi:hypothetical protein